MKGSWAGTGSEWGPWIFGPFGRKARFFEQGEARLAVLSMLAEGPKHGYELIKALETRSGGMYRVSAGTIYPTLQLLEDEGMIASEQRDGKRVYQITAEGRAELEREAATVDEIWRRAANWEDWGRWMGPEIGMVAKPLGAVAKATFKAVKRTRGNAGRVGLIQELLERTVRDLEQLEKTFENQP